jgi:hypothetical protein
VVSRSGDVDTSWQGSVLLRDIADVKRLREEDGPNLVTQGSTELVHALLANDLADAMSIFTVPVVLGAGKKLFADGSAPHSYKLIRSRVSSMGLMIAHHERCGEVKVADMALAEPSKAEAARQQRMKREGESLQKDKNKPKRKPAKGGRKQDYLRTTVNAPPGVDLTARRQAAHAAKHEFDAAHAKGMRGLRSGDAQALDRAIKDEAIAIKKLAAVPLYKPPRRRRRA